MTKLEEQEIYYDNLLDKICAMDESTQMEYLSKLDEATATNVMKSMIRRVTKKLNTADKSLNKLKGKLQKAGDEKNAEIKNMKFFERIDRIGKMIATFKKDYLTGTDGEHIWAKIVDNPTTLSQDQQNELGELTGKDIKQAEKDGKYDAKNTIVNGRA
jgi:hypothetical protein